MKKKTNTPRTDKKIKSLRQPFDPDVSAVEAQASFDALAEFARKLERMYNRQIAKRRRDSVNHPAWGTIAKRNGL